MRRSARWARLAGAGVFDLAVVGGGATGLGVALDAALRGFSVTLLESHDFGSGTSSRSTKLLHGGVRYLAQGHLGLVREALAERATVMRLAPHLAQPLPFVMPALRWWHAPFYGLGLKFYDVLAGPARLGRTRWLSRAQTLAALPGVRAEGLRGGVRYWDGQFDDARLVSPSQGVHLVVSRDFMPGEEALLVPRTQDGRVLFAVPWMGALVLGTTDTPRSDLPREPQPFDAELDFLLSEATRVLSRPVRRADIRSQWVGLRPLVAPPTKAARGGTQALSREHTIVTDPNGLLTATGGKWTTYRAMAEDVLQACFDRAWLPLRPAGASARYPLVGAAALGAQGVPLHRPPGPHLYGSEWPDVLACPGADRQLGFGLTEAMVRFAAREEHACTVEDMLARRWRVLFLDAAAAAEMAPAVAAILQEETQLDPGLSAFLQLAAAYRPR
ncbi:glycerol-3-phosphate dehydrogenase/oxidase [Tepidimonas sp.]|uniref:glycerol-3-phosphate dehydrogenase/oxidase n=1 Tax=Tepidimonas sp. TaxID=2002775 RepID=UPI002FE3BE7C